MVTSQVEMDPSMMAKKHKSPKTTAVTMLASKHNRWRLGERPVRRSTTWAAVFPLVSGTHWGGRGGCGEQSRPL